MQKAVTTYRKMGRLGLCKLLLIRDVIPRIIWTLSSTTSISLKFVVGIYAIPLIVLLAVALVQTSISSKANGATFKNT